MFCRLNTPTFSDEYTTMKLESKAWIVLITFCAQFKSFSYVPSHLTFITLGMSDVTTSYWM